ncbi:MAG: dephospho-CoA kinase [Pseudomonadota bacterium]
MSRRPFVLGLTGSIGMGKSTAADMLRDEGLPVWDADAVVHRAYAHGGEAVDLVRDLCPKAVVDGAVDRTRLRDWVQATPGALRQLEAKIHPIVAEDRARFIAAAEADIVVADIPLLFETGAETSVDSVAVVSTDAQTQKERVLSRPGMTEDLFAAILAKQMPDAEKRARADFIIPSKALEPARAAIKNMLANIRKGLPDA